MLRIRFRLARLQLNLGVSRTPTIEERHNCRHLRIASLRLCQRRGSMRSSGPGSSGP